MTVIAGLFIWLSKIKPFLLLLQTTKKPSCLTEQAGYFAIFLQQ